MALDNTHLYCASPAGDSGQVQLMVYNNAGDALATIEADGYFDSLAAQFRDDDFLFVNGSDGSAVYRVVKTTGDIALTKLGSTAVGALAALTENSTDIGGTQDNNFATLALAWDGATDPTAAEATLLIDAIREIAAKVNAIIAASS